MSKPPRIELEATELINQYKEAVDEVLEIIGYSGSLVTDKSTLFDFISLFEEDQNSNPVILALEKTFQRDVTPDEYIWALAKELAESL